MSDRLDNLPPKHMITVAKAKVAAISVAANAISEYQRRIRTRLSLAAYAYEKKNYSFMSDAEFDALAKKVDTNILTDHPVMDKFFKEQFSPDTGMWINFHPELEKLASLFEKVYERREEAANKKVYGKDEYD